MTGRDRLVIVTLVGTAYYSVGSPSHDTVTIVEKSPIPVIGLADAGTSQANNGNDALAMWAATRQRRCSMN